MQRIKTRELDIKLGEKKGGMYADFGLFFIDFRVKKKKPGIIPSLLQFLAING